MKNVIQELIAYEPNLDAKLDLLTAIGTTTANTEVWNATEEVRNELCTDLAITKEQILNSLPGQDSKASELACTNDGDTEENGHGLFT